jgi:5-methylcytosine-specific restriction endonuclease McrA
MEFNRKTRRAIIERAGGKCEVCSANLKPGEGEVDHILPDALGGEPTQSNGRLLCRSCHKAKTADDIRRVRKADRQRDKATGAFKRKSSLSHPRFKKRMDGTVIDRTTGEVVNARKAQ